MYEGVNSGTAVLDLGNYFPGDSDYLLALLTSTTSSSTRKLLSYGSRSSRLKGHEKQYEYRVLVEPAVQSTAVGRSRY